MTVTKPIECTDVSLNQIKYCRDCKWQHVNFGVLIERIFLGAGYSMLRTTPSAA